ncbi:(2Fe-2S)-binding protein [Serratia ureilytica]
MSSCCLRYQVPGITTCIIRPGVMRHCWCNWPGFKIICDSIRQECHAT